MERSFHMLVYRLFHAQRAYLRPCLGEAGLEVGQPKLLAYLADNGPSRQNQIAEYFDIDSAAVSRMLDSLEKGGFVTRKMDEGNRRCNQVACTERGRQANRLWRNRCQGLEDKMLADFTPEEQAQFSAYLARAYRNLREEGNGHA